MREALRAMIVWGVVAAGTLPAHAQPTPARDATNPQPAWTSPADTRTEPTPAAPAKRDPAIRPATFNEQKPALPLSAPGKTTKQFGEHGASSLPGLFTLVLSLSVVLGLFFLMTWLFRRGLPKGTALLPAEAIEVLGRTPVANRQFIHLIRCGNKLLLVAATPGGLDALSEITDPLEVDRLLGLCRQSQPGSVSGTFKQLLNQFAGERRPAAGSSPRASNESTHGSLLDAEVADG